MTRPTSRCQLATHPTLRCQRDTRHRTHNITSTSLTTHLTLELNEFRLGCRFRHAVRLVFGFSPDQLERFVAAVAMIPDEVVGDAYVEDVLIDYVIVCEVQVHAVRVYCPRRSSSVVA